MQPCKMFNVCHWIKMRTYKFSIVQFFGTHVLINCFITKSCLKSNDDCKQE